MSLSNNDIDKIFQKAANRSDVPVYSDTYWDEMESILEKNAPKKKRGFFWIFSGIIACGALVILGLNYNSTLPVSSQSSNKINQAEKSQLVSNAVQSFDKMAEENQSHSDLKILSGNEVKSITTSNRIAKKENTRSQIIPSTIKEEMKEIKHSLAFSNEKKYPVEKSSKIVAKKFASPREFLITSRIDDISRESKVNTSTSKTNITKLSKETEKGIDFIIEPSLKLTPLQIEVLPTQDLATDIYYRKSQRKNSFYGIIGAGSSQKLTEAQTGIPLTVNIGVGYQLNKNSVFGRIGLEANTSFLPGIEVSQRSVVYNFGVSNFTNNYQYTKLIDLEIPLEVGFNFKKTSIGIGTKVSYLIGTEMELSQRKDDEEILSGKYYGQTIGLNRLNLSSYITAETQLNKKISIGARAGITWKTRVNPEIIVSEPKINAIFGNVFLKYNF